MREKAITRRILCEMCTVVVLNMATGETYNTVCSAVGLPKREDKALIELEKLYPSDENEKKVAMLARNKIERKYRMSLNDFIANAEEIIEADETEN